MTPEQQNIAIAEALGRKADRPLTGWHDLGCNCQECYPLPSYHSDLNACAEFESAHINATNESLYRNFLVLQCGEWRYHRATAPQRCEAFLRAKGLWKDKP
jgi:hypothetical protein